MFARVASPKALRRSCLYIFSSRVAWCSRSSGMLSVGFFKKELLLAVHDEDPGESHASSTCSRSSAHKELIAFPQGSGSPMDAKRLSKLSICAEEK